MEDSGREDEREEDEECVDCSGSVSLLMKCALERSGVPVKSLLTTMRRGSQSIAAVAAVASEWFEGWSEPAGPWQQR